MTPFAEWVAGRRDSARATDVSGFVISDRNSLDGLQQALDETLELQRRLQFIGQLNAEKRKWHDLHLAQSSLKYAAGMDALAKSLETAISEIVSPLLQAGVQRKAVSDFCSILKMHLKHEPGEEITISSPPSLVRLVEHFLGVNEIGANISVTSESELKASIGSTEFATELDRWSKELQAIVFQ